MHAIRRLAMFAALLGCTACSPPPDPPDETPPEPRADATRDAAKG